MQPKSRSSAGSDVARSAMRHTDHSFGHGSDGRSSSQVAARNGGSVSVLARIAVTDRDCIVDESWLTGRRMASRHLRWGGSRLGSRRVMLWAASRSWRSAACVPYAVFPPDRSVLLLTMATTALATITTVPATMPAIDVCAGRCTARNQHPAARGTECGCAPTCYCQDKRTSVVPR
jgi:hypothetical protein